MDFLSQGALIVEVAIGIATVLISVGIVLHRLKALEKRVDKMEGRGGRQWDLIHSIDKRVVRMEAKLDIVCNYIQSEPERRPNLDL